jgi:hypothetical protein
LCSLGNPEVDSDSALDWHITGAIAFDWDIVLAGDIVDSVDIG